MKPEQAKTFLAVGLLLSLSVNFFLGGLMLGDAYDGRRAADDEGTVAVKREELSDKDKRRIEWQKREEALSAALSAADRAIMASFKAVHEPIFEDLRKALDEGRSRVGRAMDAEPFDAEALESAMAAEAAAKARMLREMTRTRREVMEKLSPEGRETLRKMMPARRGGRSAQDEGKGPHAGQAGMQEPPPPPHDDGLPPPAQGGDMPNSPAPDAALQDTLQKPAMPVPAEQPEP